VENNRKVVGNHVPSAPRTQQTCPDKRKKGKMNSDTWDKEVQADPTFQTCQACSKPLLVILKVDLSNHTQAMLKLYQKEKRKKRIQI
jgi:hypothetical protein